MDCYQCEKEVNWLAPDSRCKDCTRLTPEEVVGKPSCELVSDDCGPCEVEFDCCDCGGNECGCRGCWSCNACDHCKEERQ